MQTSSTLTHTASTNAPAIPEYWVEKLFERLEAILGTRMADVFAGAKPEAVKREWAEALYGFGDDELRRGIASTRTRKFPPNLPEFLHLCRPALDPETAWIEAEAGMRSHAAGEAFKWSHRAVYWAGRKMMTELRESRFDKNRKRWESVLASEFAKGAWASPPDPTARRLAHQQQDMVSPTSRDEARARLAEIRKRHSGYASPAEEREAKAAAAGSVSVADMLGQADETRPQ